MEAVEKRATSAQGVGDPGSPDDHKRIAVVGHAGFVGSSLCPVLEARGAIVDRYGRDNQLHDQATELLECSDVVVWLANSTSPSEAKRGEGQAAADHTALTLALSRLERLPTPPRIVLASSGGTVYDSSAQPPYDERARLADDQSAAYAQAKLALERTLAESTLEGTVLRLSNPYGPGQSGRRGQGVIAHWLRGLLAGEAITVLGNSVRDYVFIDDVADAFARACLATTHLPAVVNIGSGQPCTLEDLLAQVLRVAGNDPVTVTREPPRPVDREAVWLDVSLAEEVLGWAPSTGLEDGLRRTWEWAARVA